MSNTSLNLPIISEDAAFSRYLAKINALPILTEEEEYNLAMLWKHSSDLVSAQKLVSSHLRMVPKIASQYKGYGLPMMDMVAEGNIGLMHAVRKYEPEMGYRFSTYALWWIKASIQDYILKSWSLVKISSAASQKKLFFNLRKLKHKIQSLNLLEGKDMDEADYISKELGVEKSAVLAMDAQMLQPIKSLDHKDSDDEVELLEIIPSNDPNQEELAIERSSFDFRKNKLLEAMSILTDREKEILEARHMNDKGETLAILSEKFCISKERVRQIEAAALKKLKEHLSQTLSDDTN